MLSDIILMAHATFGVFGIIAAVWLFVEVLNTSEANQVRTRLSAWATAGFMWLAYFAGGYWYVTYYGADKAVIKAGPWRFAHSFVMETKEHVFLILLLLATFGLIAVLRNNLLNSKGARQLVLTIAGLVAALGIAMEGAGALVAFGMKKALQAAG